MKIKIFFTAILAMLYLAPIHAADNLKDSPAAVSESKLSPRSEIIPYSSRDAALKGGRELSDYVVPLEEWKSERVDGGTRYSTRYKVPFKWNDRVVLLRIEDAGGSFDVEVNGNHGGYSASGRGRSEFDLTKMSVENYNDLSVTVYDDYAAKMLENGRSDVKNTIGRAYIVSQPKVRIQDLLVTANSEGAQGLLTVEVLMESHLLNSKDFTVYYELVSPMGENVASGHRTFSTGMLTNDNVVFFANIPDVLQWNHETPYLYTLVVKTQYEGRYKEYVPAKVGFRSLAYADGEFTVCGRKVDMVPREASYTSSYEQTYDNLEQLKKQGITMIMTSGGPQPDDFYTICDRLGLYVCDLADVDTSLGGEITRGGNPSNDPQWTAACVDRAMAMYYSSRRHPSVVAFSPAKDSRNGICLYESYLALKELEPIRPIYYNAAGGQWNSDGISFANSSSPIVSGVKVSATSADIADRHVVIENLSWINSFVGTVNYEVMKGRSVKKTVTEKIRIAPGQSVTGSFSTDGIKGSVDKVAVRVVKEDIPFEYMPVEAIAEQPKRNLVALLKDSENNDSPTTVSVAEESFDM